MGATSPPWAWESPSWGVLWLPSGKVFRLGQHTSGADEVPLYVTPRWGRSVVSLVSDSTGSVEFSLDGATVFSLKRFPVEPVVVGTFLRGRMPVVTLLSQNSLQKPSEDLEVIPQADRPKRVFKSTKKWGNVLDRRAKKLGLPNPNLGMATSNTVSNEYYNVHHHLNQRTTTTTTTATPSTTFLTPNLRTLPADPSPMANFYRKRPSSSSVKKKGLWCPESGGLSSSDSRRLYDRWSDEMEEAGGKNVLLRAESVFAELQTLLGKMRNGDRNDEIMKGAYDTYAPNIGGTPETCRNIEALNTATSCLILGHLIPFFGSVSTLLLPCLETLFSAVYSDFPKDDEKISQNPKAGIRPASAPSGRARESEVNPNKVPCFIAMRSWKGKGGGGGGDVIVPPQRTKADRAVQRALSSTPEEGFAIDVTPARKTVNTVDNFYALSSLTDFETSNEDQERHNELALREEVAIQEDTEVVSALKEASLRQFAMTLLSEQRASDRQILRVHFNGWRHIPVSADGDNWQDIMKTARDKMKLRNYFALWRSRYALRQELRIEHRVQVHVADLNTDSNFAVHVRDTRAGWAALNDSPRAPTPGSPRMQEEEPDDNLETCGAVSTISVDAMLLRWMEIVQENAGRTPAAASNFTLSFVDGTVLLGLCSCLYTIHETASTKADLDLFFNQQTTPTVLYSTQYLETESQSMNTLIVAAFFRQWVEQGLKLRAESGTTQNHAHTILQSAFTAMSKYLGIPSDRSGDGSWVSLIERVRLHTLQNLITLRERPIHGAFTELFDGHADGLLKKALMSTEVREVFSENQIMKVMSAVFAVAAQDDDEITLMEFRDLLQKMRWLNTHVTSEDMHLVFTLCQAGGACAMDALGGDGDSTIDPGEFTDAFAILSSFFVNDKKAALAAHLRWFFGAHFLPAVKEYLHIDIE